MRSKVCLVDYGVGNLQSIRNAVKTSTSEELDLVSQSEELLHYEKVILPGVGAFGDAMAVIRERGLELSLLEVYRRGTPLLGICVGMQILAEVGMEHGEHKGLGIIPGAVTKIRGEAISSIHMGWNDIQIQRSDPLLEGIENGTDFYFVHGYALETPDPAVVVASMDFGSALPAVIRNNNAWGVQFHPEKSQQQGVNVLKNFVRMGRC